MVKFAKSIFVVEVDKKVKMFSGEDARSFKRLCEHCEQTYIAP